MHVRTKKIIWEATIGKPSGGRMISKIFPVRREIALEWGNEVVVVAGIHCRVAEDEKRRNTTNPSTSNAFTFQQNTNQKHIITRINGLPHFCCHCHCHFKRT